MSILSDIKLDYVPGKTVSKKEIDALRLPKGSLGLKHDVNGNYVLPHTLTIQRIDEGGNVLSNDVLENEKIAQFLGRTDSCKMQFFQAVDEESRRKKETEKLPF